MKYGNAALKKKERKKEKEEGEIERETEREREVSERGEDATFVFGRGGRRPGEPAAHARGGDHESPHPLDRQVCVCSN